MCATTPSLWLIINWMDFVRECWLIFYSFCGNLALSFLFLGKISVGFCRVFAMVCELYYNNDYKAKVC